MQYALESVDRNNYDDYHDDDDDGDDDDDDDDCHCHCSYYYHYHHHCCYIIIFNEITCKVLIPGHS